MLMTMIRFTLRAGLICHVVPDHDLFWAQGPISFGPRVRSLLGPWHDLILVMGPILFGPKARSYIGYWPYFIWTVAKPCTRYKKIEGTVFEKINKLAICGKKYDVIDPREGDHASICGNTKDWGTGPYFESAQGPNCNSAPVPNAIPFWAQMQINTGSKYNRSPGSTETHSFFPPLIPNTCALEWGREEDDIWYCFCW